MRRKKRIILSVVTIGLLIFVIYFSYYVVLPQFNRGPPNGFYYYTVKSGDSLYTIGEKLGVPYEFIADVNSLPAPFTIYPREVLLIPKADPSCDVRYQNFTSPGQYTQYHSNSTRDVIIRFDDSYQDQWVNAVPVLMKNGFPAVFAVVSGFLLNVTLCPPSYYYERMTWQEVNWLYQNGNEISDHTYSHVHLGSQSTGGLQLQVQYSLTMLEKHGITGVTSLTLPYGDGYNNATVLNYITQSGFKYIYPDDQDSFTGIINYKNPNVTMKWYAIDALDDQSFSNFQSIVANASADNVVGLMFHRVSDNVSGTGYYVNTTTFVQDMSYLHQNDFNVILPSQLPGY